MDNVNGLVASLVPQGEVVGNGVQGGGANGNSAVNAKVVRVVAKAMNVWAPNAKKHLAACLGINPTREQQPTPETLKVRLEAIGSGVVLKPLLDISLDDERTMHEILTEELRKGDPLGHDTTFIFLQGQKICVLEKRPQDYHSEGELNLQVARKYVPGKAAALAAVRQDGWALSDAADELKADRDVVLAAVSQNGYALRLAADELRADREVVLAAVGQDGDALKYASDELKADRDFILAAVSINDYVFRNASPELRADREVVLAAVRNKGYDLNYAAAELRADKDVVLAAVGQNSGALRFASDELKANREVVLAAVRKNGWALMWASDELQADPEIRAAAGRL